MKLFAPALLLLCMSALCITSIAGFYNQEHPLLMNAKTRSQGQPEPHKIHKRQGDSNQDDVCSRVLTSEVCNSGYYQELAGVSLLCNSSVFAESLTLFCAFDQMNEFCGDIVKFDLVSDIEILCNSFISSCSQECRDHLMRTRSELGCCVNAFNGSSFFDNASFAYALWSSCGVEPVTQQCSFPFTLPQLEVDPTCNSNIVFGERFQSVSCRQQYVQSYRDRLSATEGCNDTDSSCNINRFGTYCQLFATDINSNFTTADLSCGNTSTCDPLCIDTLNSITNTVGCCFNDHFNDTDTVQYDWLSYEFWSMCGLESPGLCEEFLNTDTPFITITTTTTTESPSDAVIIKAASSIVATLAVTLALM